MRKVTILSYLPEEAHFERILKKDEHHSEAMEEFSLLHQLGIKLPYDYPYEWAQQIVGHDYVVLLDNIDPRLLVFLPKLLAHCQGDWFYDNIDTFRNYTVHVCGLEEEGLRHYPPYHAFSSSFFKVIDSKLDQNKVYSKGVHKYVSGIRN